MTEQVSMLSPAGQCAFVNLLVAKPGLNPAEGSKYSIILIFDKEAQATPEFARMKEAVKKAIVDKWGANPPSGLKAPFRPSAEKADKGFPADCVFISISSKLKPEVVDAEGLDVFEASQLYTGMIGRASLSIYAYDKGGNKGVSFGLNNFQKLAAGERKYGKSSAASDFGVTAADAQVDLDGLLGA